MTKASDNQYPKLILEERLADGSDTGNPAADHRALFLGEDGALHLRDSSGTITAVGAGSGDVATDTIWDAKGDLAGGTGANTSARLAVGTNGYALVAASGETTGLAWAAQYATLNVVIDGGGAEIADGIKGDVRIDFACTITAWTLLADQSGSIVVDIWKDTLGNFPPTDADAMPGSGKEPTITTATNATDTTITDWTTDDIAAGDILRFNVDSCTTIQRATLSLKLLRV